MKVVILSLAAVLTFATVRSQNTQNRPSTSRNSQERVPNAQDSPVDIRERLVQLAMQNPGVEIDDRNILVAQYGIKRAKTNILNQVSLQGNLNEFSISQNNPYANLYPKYNIGVVVPLGLFSTRSADVNIARQNYNITIAQKNDHYRVLKEAVLTKYEDYLMDKQLVDLQRQLSEDVHSDFLKAEQDYANAKIKIDDYNRAYREYNLQNTKLITLQRNLNVDILEIERYIGVKLEDVLRDYK
jgi:outer membrane protein TolC